MSRILSGIQPSGNLHIGNYFAMMKRMIEFQNSHELFCFLANYHAMTSVNDPKILSSNILEVAADFLALGLDPDKCYFWVQSDIPEVQELTWMIACSTSLGLLERSHSFKDKIARGLVPNAGLFTYPVLMAADILMFQADKVPVGKDQKQHLEITRDIAEHFNNVFGETFKLPEELIEEKIAVVPGLDGQKMSKSYGNTILIFEEEKELKKKIMKIQTDSTPVEEPKNPDKCNLFSLYSLFASDEKREDMRKRYLAGGTGYGTIKTELFEIIRDYFKPFVEKRKEIGQNHEYIRKTLKMGGEKAREKAMETVKLVRERVGIMY